MESQLKVSWKSYPRNSYNYHPHVKKEEDLTFASLLTVGLLANCTSVALRIVFSSRMVAWDWLCPKGYNVQQYNKKQSTQVPIQWFYEMYKNKTLSSTWWQKWENSLQPIYFSHALSNRLSENKTWKAWRPQSPKSLKNQFFIMKL